MRFPSRFSSLLAAAGAAIVLAGCGNGSGGGGGASGGSTPANFPGFSTTEPDPNMIHIGLVASQNGELRPWGVDSVNGALLAVHEFNEAGGLDGKKVQLLIGDSASKPEQGKTAAEKLMGQGAIAVLGEVASGITAQMAQAAKERGIPLVAVGATRVDITDIGPDVVRVCYTDDFQGPVMATFAFEELGLRNVAIMTDRKQPYSTGLSESFRAHFTKLGGKIVDEQFYDSGATVFTGQLTNLKTKNPDGIFLSGYFTEVGPIVRQAVQAGLNAKFLGGDGWDSREIRESGGEAIVGGFFCNHYNNDEDRPEVKNFLDKWQKTFGSPPGTTMGALGYDAAALALDALKRAGNAEPKALAEAIKNTENFQGVSGVITLKGMNGDPPKRALVVKIEDDGSQSFVKAYEHGDIFK